MDRSRFCYCLSTKCRVFVDRAAQSMHSELSANGLVDLCCEREPFGLARAACFEELACVFASCGALHYAKILAILKMKDGISLTPLNCALNECLYSSRPPRSKNMQNSPEVSRFSQQNTSIRSHLGHFLPISRPRSIGTGYLKCQPTFSLEPYIHQNKLA